jgi:hypothetical protein
MEITTSNGAAFSCATPGKFIAKKQNKLKTAPKSARIFFGFIIATCRFPYASICCKVTHT